MPPRITITKCTGCAGRSQSYCEEVCPGDLMAVSVATGKAYCRAPGECWDCMSCIKMCPSGALELRIPYQLGYFKATLRPIMGKNSITWKCKDIHGNESTYSYKNRLVVK
ncbi:MAG: 4Fe-4S dicluster domain-containing protein [Desulfovibrionaceae bacterium]